MKNYRIILTLIMSAVVAFISPAQMSARGKKDKKDKKEKLHQAKAAAQREDVDTFPPSEPMPLPIAPRPESPQQPLADIGSRQFHHGNFNFDGRRGIDVSHYQGTIDWRLAATDPQVSYVYLKATESSGFVDKRYKSNLEQAQAAGLPVGVYHFFNPTASARSQFDNFRRTVDPRTQDLIPVVDVEQRGSCGLEGFRQRLQQFCDMVEREYGVKPIIYVGYYFYNKYLDGMFYGYKMFVPRYTTDNGQTPTFDPHCKVVMWQHSDKGRIKGIKGNVDLSRFCDNYNLRDILLQTNVK